MMDVATIQSLGWTLFSIASGVYLVGRFIGSKEWTVTSNTRNIARLEKELTDARQRWHAGNNETQIKINNLETEVKDMPDQLREIFVSKEVYEVQERQSERDHAALKVDINNLWSERRKRGEPRS